MTPTSAAPESPGFFRNLRKTFFTGLVLCLPLALTGYTLAFLINLLGTPARELIIKPALDAFFEPDRVRSIIESSISGFAVSLVSALLAALAVLTVGMLTRHFLGRVLFDAMEGVLERVPMVNGIYHAVKQMVDTFGNKTGTFKEVVVIEYPRAGCRTIGFVSNRGFPGPNGEKLTHVFVPTAPNPTAGFILLLPESEITTTNMTVAEGMKFLVSCGAVAPDAEEIRAAR